MADPEAASETDATAHENIDRLLLPTLRRACVRAQQLSAADDAPTAEALTLRRTKLGLKPQSVQEIDWRRLAPMLTRVPEFWPTLVALVDELRNDEDIELAIGWDPRSEVRAKTLWDTVLAHVLRHYGTVHPDWDWDEDVVLKLLGSWRQSHRTAGRARRSLAPLHNCKGTVEEVVIEQGLSLRRFTDADRIELWQKYGAERFPGAINPTIPELETWEYAVDYRWWASQQPLDDGSATSLISDAVNALRLHHPGVTGTTIIWTGPDPDDIWAADFHSDELMAPPGATSAPFHHRLTTNLGSSCGDGLRDLLEALRSIRGDRRLELVLQRFDSAYSRHAPEDRLIDLWIAFEALLLHDKGTELSYRAALRLSQLVGEDGEGKRAAFDLARLSYRRRSEVVHGTPDIEDLATVTESSRGLAREALRRWLLDPPSGGLDSLDHALLN